MSLNTFPCNPYPISTEELNKGNNDDLNARVAALEGDVSDLNSNKANQITIAPFFNAEVVYDPGDLVYYNGLSYRCVNAHEGEWDADDFAATTIAGELDTLKSGLTGLSNNVVFEPQTAPSTSNPFGDDGTGYILKVEYNSVNLGYLVIRPKNYVDTSTSRKVALELFDSSWSKIWDVVRDNT